MFYEMAVSLVDLSQPLPSLTAQSFVTPTEAVGVPDFDEVSVRLFDFSFSSVSVQPQDGIIFCTVGALSYRSVAGLTT